MDRNRDRSRGRPRSRLASVRGAWVASRRSFVSERGSAARRTRSRSVRAHRDGDRRRKRTRTHRTRALPHAAEHVLDARHEQPCLQVHSGRLHEPVSGVRIAVDDERTGREKFRLVKPRTETMRPGASMTLSRGCRMLAHDPRPLDPPERRATQRRRRPRLTFGRRRERGLTLLASCNHLGWNDLDILTRMGADA